MVCSNGMSGSQPVCARNFVVSGTCRSASIGRSRPGSVTTSMSSRVGTNVVQGSVRVAICLDVDPDDVRTGLGEGIHVTGRILDHEVHIDGEFRCGARGCNDRGTPRDVGDEASIHHVHVNVVGSSRFDFLDLRAQTQKVCTENGRGDEDLSFHGRSNTRGSGERLPQIVVDRGFERSK